MDNKKFIGSFMSEEQLLQRIADLKMQGYDDDDMFVVVKDEDDISILKARSDVDVKTSPRNWLDRFMAFLTGDEPVKEGLLRLGMSDEEANRYCREVENGNLLLYIDRNSDGYFEEDRNRMRSTYEGGIPTAFDNDLQTRPMNGMDRESDGVMNGASTGDQDGYLNHEDDEKRLKLREEQLNVDKEMVQTGEVNVHKEVVEEEQSVNIPVRREEVTVERQKVNDMDGEQMDMDSEIMEDEDIRIPIKEERIHVSKEPVVREELVIKKHEVEDTETVRDTVKREKAHVDRSLDHEEVHMREEEERRMDGDKTFLLDEDFPNNPNSEDRL